MKPIFTKNTYVQLRFFLAIIIAVIMIIVDNKLHAFTKIRTYIDTIISPIYFLINAPHTLWNNTSRLLTTRHELLLENHILKQKLLLNNNEQLLLEQYKKDNNILRKLLKLPLYQYQHKIIAKVIFTNINLYNDQLIINKGSNNGVHVGQAVLNDKGVVGQVISVNKLTSRVLLICDASHALPVQVLRNDTRTIMFGHGCHNNLKLDLLPNNIDIKIGDVLVTSGLGGRFPEGYPVAIVSSIKIDTKYANTLIEAKPIAKLQYLNYLLLIRDINSSNKTLLSPKEVHSLANKRLIQIRS